MMMRAESNILGSVETVGGVAIAAAVRENADSHLRSVMAPTASCMRHVLENAAGSLAAMACAASPNPAVGGHRV